MEFDRRTPSTQELNEALATGRLNEVRPEFLVAYVCLECSDFAGGLGEINALVDELKDHGKCYLVRSTATPQNAFGTLLCDGSTVEALSERGLLGQVGRVSPVVSRLLQIGWWFHETGDIKVAPPMIQKEKNVTFLGFTGNTGGYAGGAEVFGAEVLAASYLRPHWRITAIDAEVVEPIKGVDIVQSDFVGGLRTLAEKSQDRIYSSFAVGYYTQDGTQLVEEPFGFSPEKPTEELIDYTAEILQTALTKLKPKGSIRVFTGPIGREVVEEAAERGALATSCNLQVTDAMQNGFLPHWAFSLQHHGLFQCRLRHKA